MNVFSDAQRKIDELRQFVSLTPSGGMISNSITKCIMMV